MMTLSSVAAALILVVVATTIFAQFASRRHTPPATTGATATPGTPDSGFTNMVTLNPDARIGRLTTARDGSVWFTESTHPGGNKIGRVSPNGTLTEFPVPSDAQAIGTDLGASTFGPDGNLWFTEIEGFPDSRSASFIVRMTSTGSITKFPVSDGAFGAIISGPDDALWFAEATWVGSKIGRLTTAGRLTEYQISALGTPTPKVTGDLTDLCVGPDGAIWYARLGRRIGRLTLEGQIQEFPVPYSGYQITSGPDGALWYTEFGDDGSSPRGVPGSEIRQGFIGRITTSGVATEVPIDSHLRAQEIVSGPDQALWFTTFDPTTDLTAKLGRITTSGEVTILDTRAVGQGGYPAATSDAIWLVVSNQLWRYRLSG